MFSGLFTIILVSRYCLIFGLMQDLIACKHSMVCAKFLMPIGLSP